MLQISNLDDLMCHIKNIVVKCDAVMRLNFDTVVDIYTIGCSVASSVFPVVIKFYVYVCSKVEIQSSLSSLLNPPQYLTAV